MLAILFLTFAVTVDPSDLVPERLALFQELDVGAKKVQQLATVKINFPTFQFPGSSFFLFNINGKVLGNAPASQELLNAYNKSNHLLKPTIIFERGALVVGPQQVVLNNHPYQLYLTKKIPRLVHWRFKHALARQWHLVAIALSISFVLCIILANYLVGPVRQLQKASRKLAAGDLATRVGNNVIKRKDELGELGQDFDNMAEQLESLVNSKQRLLRDVSHELRSPLTRLQLSLALASKKAPEAVDEHSRIEREVSRLDQLIDQIIRYSRIQHGISEQASEQVNLQLLVKQLVEDGKFEAQACNKSVILTKSTDIHILAVHDFISSAIENIIRNAIRFTPKESLVEVSLDQVNSHAVIIIRDYGPGVPENTLNLLFEPFFRVDETRGEGNNEKGLGMAIAHRAVTFHKGTLVASNASPGLKVKITLPL